MTNRHRKLLVAPDLDALLLRTRDLERAILWILFEEFGILPSQFLAEMTELTTDGEGYDLFAHLERRGVNAAAAELMLLDRLRAPNLMQTGVAEYVTRCRREIFGDQPDPDPFTGSFLFDGALEFLKGHESDPDTDLLITTTGPVPYQVFKLKLVGLLYLLHHILSGNKGEWYAKLWANGTIQVDETGYPELNGTEYDEAMFLDDKRSALLPLAGAPAAVRLYHLLRAGSKYPQHTGLLRITEVDHLAKIN